MKVDDIMDKEELGQLWEDAIASIQARFDLPCQNRELEIIEKDPSPESLSVWELRVSDGSLIYHEKNLNSTPLLYGVIAREACRVNLPTSLKDETARFDIACEYGRQIIDDSLVEEWLSHWEADSPRISLDDGTRYRPRLLFQILWHLGEEQALNRLVGRLSQMSKHNVVLGFNGWVKWFLRYIVEYERPLTATEMIIVDVLVKDPTADRQTIAERADVSPRWVSTVQKRLEKRGQLMEFDLVAYSKIGIRVFQIILQPNTENQVDPSFLLDECPFVFSSSNILTGNQGIYATLCIPDNPANISHLNRLSESAREYGINVFVFERYESGNWLNLDAYEANTGEWSFDWESLRMEGVMMQREDLAFLYPDISLSGPSKEYLLDRIDIRLLLEFEKGHKSTRSLRDALGIRMDEVVRRLNELRANEIIIKSWEVHHIGLLEEAVVYTEEKMATNCVAALGLRLPRCFLDYDSDERLFMRARLPKGGAFGLAHALEPIKSLSGVHLVGDRMWGRWRLSDWLDEWDLETGCWRPTSKNLSHWYGSMEEGPDTAA